MSSVIVKSKSGADEDPAVASFVLNSASDPYDMGVISPLSAVKEIKIY